MMHSHFYYVLGIFFGHIVLLSATQIKSANDQRPVEDTHLPRALVSDMFASADEGNLMLDLNQAGSEFDGDANGDSDGNGNGNGNSGSGSADSDKTSNENSEQRTPGSPATELLKKKTKRPKQRKQLVAVSSAAMVSFPISTPIYAVDEDGQILKGGEWDRSIIAEGRFCDPVELSTMKQVSIDYLYKFAGGADKHIDIEERDAQKDLIEHPVMFKCEYCYAQYKQ